MSWYSRLLNIVRPGRLDHELHEELESHVAARTEDLMARGMTVEAAREQARRQLGNVLLLREKSRDIKLFSRLESVFKDIAFGIRLCRRNAIVTSSAIISLSLAIGACTAAFSLVDAMILKPLPVKDPERLIYIAQRAPGDSRDGLSFNYPLFELLRDAGRAQVHLFGVSDQSRRDAIFDDGNGQTEKVYGQWISGDAFALLGIKPALGRLLTGSDDFRPGQHPV